MIEGWAGCGRRLRPGFTLLEVLVAAVVFMTAVAGIMAALRSLKTASDASLRRAAALAFGKKFLDSLASEVRADSWGTFTSRLQAGEGDLPDDPDFPNCAGTWRVTNAPDGGRNVSVESWCGR